MSDCVRHIAVCQRACFCFVRLAVLSRWGLSLVSKKVCFGLRNVHLAVWLMFCQLFHLVARMPQSPAQ